MAFLCNLPDEYDYKKLTKVMQYLRFTHELMLTIEPGPSCWLDSSYAVNLDMRSHSGIYTTLGKGAMFMETTKQKLNTKSSNGSRTGGHR